MVHRPGADDSSSEDDIPLMSPDTDAGGPAVSSQGGSRYEDAVERQEAGSEADDEAEISNPLPVGRCRLEICREPVRARCCNCKQAVSYDSMCLQRLPRSFCITMPATQVPVSAPASTACGT